MAENSSRDRVQQNKVEEHFLIDVLAGCMYGV